MENRKNKTADNFFKNRTKMERKNKNNEKIDYINFNEDALINKKAMDIQEYSDKINNNSYEAKEEEKTSNVKLMKIKKIRNSKKNKEFSISFIDKKEDDEEKNNDDIKILNQEITKNYKNQEIKLIDKLKEKKISKTRDMMENKPNKKNDLVEINCNIDERKKTKNPNTMENEYQENKNNLDKFLLKNTIIKEKNKQDSSNPKIKTINMEGEVVDNHNNIYNCDIKSPKFRDIGLDTSGNIYKDKYDLDDQIDNFEKFKSNFKEQKKERTIILENMNNNSFKIESSFSKDKIEDKDIRMIFKSDKNSSISLELNETNGNLNILESRKNKNNFNNVPRNKFEQEVYKNNFYSNINDNLFLYKNISKKYISSKDKNSSHDISSNTINNLNYDNISNSNKGSISPKRREIEKKLIFVKSNESIKLNKLNELSFGNEANKNTLLERNSSNSNKPSVNSNKTNFSIRNSKSMQTGKKNMNVNNDEEINHIKSIIQKEKDSHKMKNVFDILNKKKKLLW